MVCVCVLVPQGPAGTVLASWWREMERREGNQLIWIYGYFVRIVLVFVFFKVFSKEFVCVCVVVVGLCVVVVGLCVVVWGVGGGGCMSASLRTCVYLLYVGLQILVCLRARTLVYDN